MKSPPARIDMLSVVMPAYNEQASIERVVLDHVQVLQNAASIIARWEIVVVDDGSTDDTPNILRALQASVPQLRFVQQANQGIFGAFSRGYREARGSYVYSTGSDGQWPPENLTIMAAFVTMGADLVIGVRANRGVIYSPMRRLVSSCFNLIPSLLFGVRVEDAGSIKLGRSEVFRYDLVSRSPFLEAERILRAQRSGLKLAFAPILFNARDAGQATGASWRNIWRSLQDVAKCVRAYGLR